MKTFKPILIWIGIAGTLFFLFFSMITLGMGVKDEAIGALLASFPFILLYILGETI